MTFNWFKYASPAMFYPVAGKMIPWFAWAAAVLAAIGVYTGLVVAPTDFQQGDSYRIIFIHVPAAWMSMFLYLVMAFWKFYKMVLVFYGHQAAPIWRDLTIFMCRPVKSDGFL